jgi:cell wall-associated NlpC family hydrolase
MVDKISTLVGQLQDQATAAGIRSEQAVEAYNQAQAELDDATQKASELASQADAAQKTAETSTVRAGLLASHLMRTAGTNGSMGLLLQGNDSGAADKLLYQLGTMSQLTEQSKRVYDQAIADRNTAQSLAEQAKAAQQARQKASDAAKQALKNAQDAAAEAQVAVTTPQQKQGELTAQLASLQNTSVEVAAQYVAGQQAIAAAKAAAAAAEKQREAEAAAERQRQAAAAAAAQQQQHQTGGGTAAKPPAAPSTPPVTSAPPRTSIVDAAVNYALAQVGKPYIINGAGPAGYDCSGLSMQAYAAAGLYIGGHGVIYQYKYAAAHGQLVSRSNWQRGDLIFWGTAPNGLYHVGIYLGNGQMVAAPQVGENVKIQSVWGAPIDVVARPSIGH